MVAETEKGRSNSIITIPPSFASQLGKEDEKKRNEMHAWRQIYTFRCFRKEKMI